MQSPTVEQLIPTLQISIGPVILISGIGLLLLSMTNRFGRTIDRARELERARRTATGADVARIEEQIAIIAGRGVTLRRAIFLATVSVLLASVLIISLFIMALLQVEAAWLITLIFVACMLTLIGALIDSIRDINQSLHALKLELGQGS
ncbi:MAG: DUF2721 domain-containing protein [Thermoanaerobaculia bacterium]